MILFLLGFLLGFIVGTLFICVPLAIKLKKVNEGNGDYKTYVLREKLRDVVEGRANF